MSILSEFLKQQKTAIIAEFSNEMVTCFGSITRRQLEKVAKRRDWIITPLPGTDFTSVLIVKKSERAFPELWVHRCYRSYRRAFKKFLTHIHGDIEVPLPRHLQVDHSVPTHRFKKNHPAHFIRVFLIEQKVNAAFGAGFEKSFYQRERNTKPASVILLSWLTFLKLYGATLPGKTKKPVVWEDWSMHWAEEMAAKRVGDKRDAYFGILGVLRLGYTGFFTGSSDEGSYEFRTTETGIPYMPPSRCIQNEYEYELKAIDDDNCVITYKASGDGEGSLLPMRRELFNDYEGKFKWGYMGTGPQFLATSILAHHLGHDNFGMTEIESLLKKFLAGLPFSAESSPFYLNTNILELILAGD